MTLWKTLTTGEPATLPTGRRLLMVAILGAVTALGPFTMDLYLPAFPAVMAAFHTSQGAVQLTLTATAVGMGVGQLIIGPLSDAVGRRLPLIIATALHVAASVGVAVAPGIGILGAMRFGQGMGAAATAVITVAIVRDLFEGYPLVRTMARIALVNGFAPVIAPVIGSQLLLLMDWRGIFVILAGFGVAVCVAATLVIPETREPNSRQGSHCSASARRFRELVGDRIFLGTALVGSLVFAALVTYLSTSPFIFQQTEHLSAQEFGTLFAIIAVGLLVATQSSAILMRWFEPSWLLACSLLVLLGSGAALILLPAVPVSFVLLAAACLVLVASCGFSMPCLQVLALQNHRDRSGTAAALGGFVNSVLGGVISALPGLLGTVSAFSLGLVVLASAAGAMGLLWTVVRPWSVPRLVR